MTFRRFRLSTGRLCVLSARPLPLLRSYHVLSVADRRALSPREEEEMVVVAQRSGRRVGRRFYGDPQCFAVVYSGARGRRRPWAHFHLVAVRSVADKRWKLLVLHCKRVLLAVLRIQRMWQGPATPRNPS